MSQIYTTLIITVISLIIVVIVVKKLSAKLKALKESFLTLKEGENIFYKQLSEIILSLKNNAEHNYKYDNLFVKNMFGILCLNKYDTIRNSDFINIKNQIESVLYLDDENSAYSIKTLPIVGLLGTFLGLIIVVFSMAYIISNLTASESLEQIIVVMSGISTSTSGMAIAFMSSFLALSSSLYFGGKFSNLQKEKEQWLDNAMYRIQTQMIPIFNSQIKENLTEQYFSSMSTALEKSLGNFYASHFETLRKTTESFELKLEKFLSKFEKNSDLKIERMISVGEKSFAHWNEVKDNLEQLTKNLDNGLTHFLNSTTTEIARSQFRGIELVEKSTIHIENNITTIQELISKLLNTFNSLHELNQLSVSMKEISDQFKLTSRALSKSLTSSNIFMHLRKIESNLENLNTFVIDYNSTRIVDKESDFSFNQLYKVLKKEV